MLFKEGDQVLLYCINRAIMAIVCDTLESNVESIFAEHSEEEQVL